MEEILLNTSNIINNKQEIQIRNTINSNKWTQLNISNIINSKWGILIHSTINSNHWEIRLKDSNIINSQEAIKLMQ